MQNMDKQAYLQQLLHPTAASLRYFLCADTSYVYFYGLFRNAHGFTHETVADTMLLCHSYIIDNILCKAVWRARVRRAYSRIESANLRFYEMIDDGAKHIGGVLFYGLWLTVFAPAAVVMWYTHWTGRVCANNSLSLSNTVTGGFSKRGVGSLTARIFDSRPFHIWLWRYLVNVFFSGRYIPQILCFYTLRNILAVPLLRLNGWWTL
jgi:hypothetical protein